MKPNWTVVAVLALLAPTVTAQVDPSTYVNFEGAQTDPLRLSPDGRRLFAVNTPDARVSVFDLSQPATPTLIAEIPVGIEPVSVNALTSDEAWVVNQVSDSISVVSVSRGIVTHTIPVKDEPADVVFVEPNLAFVSVSRNNQVRVFDTATHALLKTIPLFGHNPRTLAVNAAGTKVYVAFALAGNRTTILPIQAAPPPPVPTNPALPPAPPFSLIVDAADPEWSSVIRYRMPDFDVAEIDTALLAVTRYFSGVGTTNLGMALRPFTGEVYVANTEARNLARFLPNLKGHWVDNRVTRISAAGLVTPIDLNPSIDYATLPNPEAQAIAIAQPTALVFEPLGRFLFVAAFGTDRIAVLNGSGTVLSRIELGAVGSNVDPRQKRGPRGLALHAAARRLYVLNRLSNTISIVDLSTEVVLSEIPVGGFDPTPQVIRDGRGFLYDAKLSGNGTGSCASCHVDADMDHLAWDLGDPGGSMETVDRNGTTFQMHPMKGPKTTQTLRGLEALEPYHWRGDRDDFAAFNEAFPSLMGGSRIPTADMDAYTAFVNTIRFQPNPFQSLDRTLPTSVGGGNPRAGAITFLTEVFDTNTTCNTCHRSTPGPGTDLRVLQLPHQDQPTKHPHLRNVYQKLHFTNVPGRLSLTGFGLNNDGELTLLKLLSLPRFGQIATDPVRKANVAAFLMCFDTGTPPAVGYTRTVTSGTLAKALADWTVLEQQAAIGNIDLIVKGSIDGDVRGLLHRSSTADYVMDTTSLAPLTRAQLIEKIQGGAVLTVMAVPLGSGLRMGIDRNLDGVLDGD